MCVFPAIVVRAVYGGLLFVGDEGGADLGGVRGFLFPCRGAGSGSLVSQQTPEHCVWVGGVDRMCVCVCVCR